MKNNGGGDDLERLSRELYESGDIEGGSLLPAKFKKDLVDR